jgi:LmbE family N-acetylglucosaminyl deacetylase
MTGANDIQIETLKFRNSYFPYEGVKIKEYFKTLQSTCKPDLILTHYRNDMHQDHRLISELTWNTYRDHAVLEYEIPKFDGDLGQPNVFVPLAEAAVNEKIQCLMKNFPSQVTRSWFTEETFLGLLRLRGIECNSATGYAEGYFARKLNVSI